MIIQNIYKAKASLSALVNEALAGKDVFISKAGKPQVKLVPVGSVAIARQPGDWKEKVFIKSDFDELPKYLLKAFGVRV